MTLAELKSRVTGGPDYAKARAEAARILSDAGVTRPPINPERIAESLGIKVIFAEFEPEVSTDLSGFFDFESNTIIVNEAIPTRRKTFTIAHELGHAILHREYVKSAGYQVLPRSNRHEAKPIEEVEADVFAACLLVPKHLLRKYQTVADTSELSDVFVVSRDVIIHQLKYI